MPTFETILGLLPLVSAMVLALWLAGQIFDRSTTDVILFPAIVLPVGKTLAANVDRFAIGDRITSTISER